MLKQVIFVIQHVFRVLKQTCGSKMSNLMARNSKFSGIGDSSSSSGNMFRKSLEHDLSF